MKKETIKRAAAVTLAALMAGSALAGCGGNASSNTDSKGDSKAESSKTESKADATGGKVYYLNFKPEQDQAWQDLAKKYTEETGTEVTVVTAAEGTYEQTLTSEMAKGDEAPTLFQVNGHRHLRPAHLQGLRSGERRQGLWYRLCNRVLWPYLQQDTSQQVFRV